MQSRHFIMVSSWQKSEWVTREKSTWNDGWNMMEIGAMKRDEKRNDGIRHAFFMSASFEYVGHTVAAVYKGMCFFECEELWGEVLAFYKDACCDRLFVYGDVICRDLAFHKNDQKMAGFHFIRISCFVRAFNKEFHVVHAFHKPYGFMKCHLSHPPGIQRGMVFPGWWIIIVCPDQCIYPWTWQVAELLSQHRSSLDQTSVQYCKASQDDCNGGQRRTFIGQRNKVYQIVDTTEMRVKKNQEN